MVDQAKVWRLPTRATTLAKLTRAMTEKITTSWRHAGTDLFVDDSPGAPICVVSRFWLAVSQRQRLVGDGDTKLKGADLLAA
jgi:hypothetical protein